VQWGRDYQVLLDIPGRTFRIVRPFDRFNVKYRAYLDVYVDLTRPPNDVVWGILGIGKTLPK
jgi:hypothetical protein